jgi:hypothetical protein
MDKPTTQSYREYVGEIPHNTIKTWNSVLMDKMPWELVGWSGAPKEPYRHWAAYPPMEGEVARIWEMLDFSFKEDGFNLRPERIICNLFAHGDSSWLHRDCDSDTAWTAIVYLNDFWDANWHGGTVLMDEGEAIKYFSPTPGKFILFKSNIVHGPVPVSREAPYPRLGLTFQCDSNLQGFETTEISAVSAAKL